MRFTRLVILGSVVPVSLAVFALAGFAACSSDTPAVGGTGSGTDASTTDSSVGNPGLDSSVGPSADAATDAGATDSSMQADTSVPGCMAPADCASAEVCCGTIPVTGGTVPNCTTGGVTTACKAPGSCSTKLATSCSGTQTIRLCTKNSDCTEPTDNSCCTFGDSDGGSLSFCANGLVGAFGGGKCM